MHQHPPSTPPVISTLRRPPRWLLVSAAVLVLVIAVMLAVVGCGGSPESASPAAAEPTVSGTTVPATPTFSAPVYTPPTEIGEYAGTADLIARLNASGFKCQPEGQPSHSITGSLTQTCWIPTVINATDQVRVDIYVSRQQQADGVALLKANNWQVVEGQLWTVAAQSPATARAVVDALK